MSEHRLDGNGVAGLLADIFGTEMTTAMRGCAACDAVHPVGAHLAYHGAGVVLRCPTCGDVALAVAAVETRRVVTLRGEWRMEEGGGARG